MHKDYSKIHPELRQIAKKNPMIHFNKWTVWLINRLMSLLPTPKTPQNVIIENIVIPSKDPHTNVRLRTYKPESTAAPTPILVWFHGGGYVTGNPEMDDRECSEFVQELGLSIVSVDYRHAPKHPFPAALEDGYSTLQWVISHAQDLGFDLNRLAIGGNSAGGGLAAALIQSMHDQQIITPAFQLLVYPMLDDRTVVRPDVDDRNNVVWSQKSNRFGWESYLGKQCGAADVPQYAVPARREDLSGLPPTWIGVGSLDIFHDEDVAYAKRLQECGVDCELVVVPGAFHGFDRFSRELSIIQNFRTSQVQALRKYLCF